MRAQGKSKEGNNSSRYSTTKGRGGQLNVDCRFDPILIVESTIIFRNSCRFVDRFLASKSCRL